MSYEDDLCSSGFESLQEWWVSEFEEGNEERDEGEGSDGAHSPFKSSQDERFHSVYCLRIKDEALIALKIEEIVLCLLHFGSERNTRDSKKPQDPWLWLRHSLEGEEAIEVIDGKVRQVWIDVTATTALRD